MELYTIAHRGYNESDMRRTTLLIDDELIAEARDVLGTKGIKDTIDQALNDVVRRAAGDRFIRLLRDTNGLDLLDPKVMASAWRE